MRNNNVQLSLGAESAATAAALDKAAEAGEEEDDFDALFGGGGGPGGAGGAEAGGKEDKEASAGEPGAAAAPAEGEVPEGWVPAEAEGEGAPPGPGAVVAAAAYAVCKELQASAKEAGTGAPGLTRQALELALAAGIVTPQTSIVAVGRTVEGALADALKTVKVKPRAEQQHQQLRASSSSAAKPQHQLFGGGYRDGRRGGRPEKNSGVQLDGMVVR